MSLQSSASPSVVDALAKGLSSDQCAAQNALTFMFSSVRYLGGQGQAFREHEKRDGGYVNLVMKRAEIDYGLDVKALLAKRDN